MKKISIIVPVYNTIEEYLRQCINSLINQTVIEKIEIIIVDDGSNQKTANICDEYAKKRKNIKVIHQNNAGLSVSRNNGMKIAKGKWIMFVDSDDWIEYDMCEKMLNLAKEDIDIIITSCNKCYKNEVIPINMFNTKEKVILDNREKIELQIISNLILGKECYDAKYIVTAWAKLYRRDFIAKNDLYNICNLRFREDNIFNLYCFELAEKIIYKNYKLYNYRQCKNSLINRNDFSIIDWYVEYLEEEIKFIRKFNKSKFFYEAHYLKMMQSIINITQRYIVKNKISYKEKKNKLIELLEKENFKNALYKVKLKDGSIYFKFLILLLRHKKYWLFINIIKNMNYIKHVNDKDRYE